MENVICTDNVHIFQLCYPFSLQNVPLPKINSLHDYDILLYITNIDLDCQKISAAVINLQIELAHVHILSEQLTLIATCGPIFYYA